MRFRLLRYPTSFTDVLPTFTRRTYNKVYALRDYVMVALVTLGIIVFQDSKTGGQVRTHTLGLSLHRCLLLVQRIVH